MTKLQPTLVSAIVVLALLASPLAAQDLPRQANNWHRLESDNFTFVSNTHEEVTRRIARNLEQLYSVFDPTSGSRARDRRVSPVPSTIYLFASDLDFEPYKPLDADGRPARISGYFLKQPFGNYVAINADHRQKPLATIYHEFVHSFTSVNLPGMPQWFEEGLAEFYSTFQLVTTPGEGTVAEIGRPKEEHVRWLRQHSLIPLDELLEADAQSDLYRGGHGRETTRGVFYAQSWAMVHYLLTRDGENDRNQLAMFFQSLERGDDTRTAFEKAFDRSYLDFEGDLAAYVDRGEFPFFSLPVLDMPGETDWPAERLPAHEIYVQLGDLLTSLRPPRLRAAQSHFEAALKADFENARAQAGLGRIAELKGDQDEALSRYETAAERLPFDPLVQFLYGNLIAEQLYRRSQANPGAFWNGDFDLERARHALATSIELRPDFAPAFATLGMTYLLEDPPERAGLEILTDARRLAPERSDVLHNLTVLRARLGELESAWHTIDAFLVRLDDDKALRSAREAVSRSTLQGVARLANEGRFSDAARLLEDLELRLRRGKKLDSSLAQQFRPEIERLSAAIVQQRAISNFNAAVELANSGRLLEAEKTLEQVLADLEQGPFDAQFTEQVEKALVAVRARM